MRPLHSLQILATVLSLIGLSACGSSGDSARGTFQGQSFDLNVQYVDCVAGPPSGPAISGYDGILDSPLLCSIMFENNGYFGDYLSITVSDVRPIYAQRGTWQVFDGGLIAGTVTIQGIPQIIYSGVIRFSEISNVAGRPVCADYQVETGGGHIEGHFCESVRVGY